jgi:macrolide transport system ATP-binding/permease protein
MRQYLDSREPDLTLFNATSAQNEIDVLFRITQISMFIYMGIGLYGLILAAVGVAGVTGYAVVQRTREIGIRLALGASRPDVLRLVTREGVVLVILGSVLGQAGAFGLTRLLGAWFNAISTMTKASTSDPVLLAGAPLMLGLLTLVSCYLPARRTIRIDPARALRGE